MVPLSNEQIAQQFEERMRRQRRSSYQIFWVVGTVIVIIFYFLLKIPFSISDWPVPLKEHWKDAGPVGDVFGGILGPAIAFTGMIVTFIAFYIQYVANLDQRTQFQISLAIQANELQKEKNRTDIERFEERYFELLRLHKENVSEMNIANRMTGRRCFVPMFYELRNIYIMAHRYQRQLATGIPLRKEFLNVNILNLAYSIFFYGVGYNSEKHFVHKLNDIEKELFDHLKKYIGNVQKAWDTNKEGTLQSEDGCYTYNFPIARPDAEDDISLKLYYKPFDGHVNLLGHYYRHLFQTATYITKQDALTKEEKYHYLKTLRAQLSNFEQLLLYYNASAWFLEEWKELFTTFKFIKNIPLDLADFDLRPDDEQRFGPYMKSLMKTKKEKLFEQQ